MPSRDLKVTLIGEDNTGSAFGSAGRNADGFGGKIAKYGAVAATAFVAAGAGVAVAGRAVFEHGAQLEQMGMKAETVFGDSLGQVEAWAKANGAAMGMTSRETTGLAANFADLLIPMGFTRDQAAKMSTDVVGLSGALSQWSGGTKSAAEVSEILAGAMLGETDALKSLGISLSASEIDARLAANGQKELTGAALEQAKAQAIQQLIMEKSTDAQAAYAAGGSPLLSAQSKLKATFREVYDELSVRMVPVFTAVSEWIVSKGIPLAGQLAAGFRVNVLPVLRDVGAFVATTLVPAMQDFGEWIGRNKDFLIPFAAAIGTVVAGFKIYAAIQKTVTLVTAAWNAVLLMNPIGLVVTLIAGLVAALVVAYQRSETFRDIVNGVFDAVKSAIGNAIGFMIERFEFLLRIWLTVADGIVSGAAKALGWIPGLGDKLRAANDAFDAMSAGILGTLDDAANKAYGFGEKSGSNAASGLAATKQSAFNAGRAVADDMGRGVGGGSGQAYNAGMAVGEGFANGIDASRSAAVRAAQRTAFATASAMRKGLQVASPSKLTTYFGEMVGEGLVQGMGNKQRAVSRKAGDLADLTALRSDRRSAPGYIRATVGYPMPKASTDSLLREQITLLQQQNALLRALPRETQHLQRRGALV